jgi:hypothetical protein
MAEEKVAMISIEWRETLSRLTSEEIFSPVAAVRLRSHHRMPRRPG